MTALEIFTVLCLACVRLEHWTVSRDLKREKALCLDLRKIIRERQAVDDEALRNAFLLGAERGRLQGISEQQERAKTPEVQELSAALARSRNARMN